MRIGKIIFSHILIIALILVQVPPVALSDNINEHKLIWEADEFRIVYTLNNLMLVSTHESDTKDNYDLIWLGNGKSLWGSRENPLRAYLETNDLYNKSVVCFGRRIIISSIDNTCCYDLVTGRLLWMNPAISNLTKKMVNVDGIVYSTFAKEYISSKIEYIRFNLSDGKLIDVNEIEILYESNPYEHLYVLVMGVSDKYLFILSNYEIQCYNINDKKVLWSHRFSSLYSFSIDIVGNVMVGFEASYNRCDKQTYIIYGVNIKTGKELWNVMGYSGYLVHDGYLYYSKMFCNEDYDKSINQLDVRSGKIVNSQEMNKAKLFYIPLISNNNRIVALAYLPVVNSNDFIAHFLIYDNDLSLLHDYELKASNAFKEASVRYFTETFYIMNYRLSGTQKHKTGLFALPGYIPPNPNELLRLIFDGLRGNP